MSILQNEAEIARERKNPLQDDEAKNLKITASLRDQQLDKLTDKLEEMDYGEKISLLWHTANADRSEWLTRQEGFLHEIDEFIEPIYKPALDWSSNLHLPTILTMCKTYHGRMMQALWGIDPAFVCRSRTAANSDRAQLIEHLMRYTLRDWCNNYDGVEEELDKWLWDWITKGDGFLKARWHKEFTRYMDVETTQVQDVELQMDPKTGDSVPVPVMRDVEREVAVTEEVFNGPNLKRVPVEDIIVVGGEGDPQEAEMVMEQVWLNASQLWSLADQKVFKPDVVKEIIEGGRDRVFSNDQSGNIKQTEVTMAGRSRLDSEHELDKYRFIEAYLRADVDDSGIASDIIVWLHAKSRKIVRATYLRRVITSGKRPYFKISFHKRHGVEYSVGMVELLYTLGKEIDAIHNINMDIGILSSMPFGFYRPTASSLKEESLPIEPGALIPVDNPQADIYFPNLGMRTSFGFQEQQSLYTQIERLTSISDINLGIVGAQGAARTATGARALLGESSSNLNVYINRMNRGWKRALRYMFEMLQLRMPDGFQFRIVGDDGDSYWKQIESKQEICGMYDFELDANSANSNAQVQKEQAQMIYQMSGNPLDLQLGVITAANRYEALINMLKVNGVKAVAKFTSKPANYALSFSPVEMADRLLMGIDVPLNPTMDLQGFIALVQEFEKNDELNGQFGANHMAALTGKAQEAQQMLQAMQQQQAQVAAAQQMNMNTQASQVPGNMQQPSISTPPQAGEGG